MEMVSEREIEAAIKAIEAVPIMDDTYSLSGEDAKAAARAALEAAARVRAEAAAETLIDTVSEEVWNHDASQDNCNVIDKDDLTNTGEPVAWLDRLRTYGEPFHDGRNQGTLFKFKDGSRFFLA